MLRDVALPADTCCFDMQKYLPRSRLYHWRLNHFNLMIGRDLQRRIRMRSPECGGAGIAICRDHRHSFVEIVCKNSLCEIKRNIISNKQTSKE
jgi:hypothetical protein